MDSKISADSRHPPDVTFPLSRNPRRLIDSESRVKLSSITAASILALSSLAVAQTQETKTPWLVRLRVLQMTPLNHSRAFTALATNFGSNAVELNKKTFPEVDLSYFFTPNWAAELVLTYPQQHDVTLAGVGKIGTVTHLPPILSAQYHYPIKNSAFTPYVGLGLNYTRITSASLRVQTTDLDVTRDSVGLAYGIGCDYKLTDRLSINLDFKHVNIKTNVKVAANHAILTNLDVDPNLLSIGIGYRF
jgi:outer membrane protein